MSNIVITAASSDLAKAFVTLAGQDGANALITTSRSTRYKPEPCAAQLRHLPGIDLTGEAALRALQEQAQGFFSGPFSIVHFAGDYWVHKPLVRTQFAEIRSLIESHYLTLCGVAHFLTPVMIAKGGGRLVAFSCNSVGYNYPDLAPFTSAKAAIESFIRSYSNEYAEYGVAATAIALPTMKTAKVLEEKVQGDQKNYITPEEFAAILLNDVLAQSGYVTGNLMRLVKYSETFYHDSYFGRNPRTQPIK